MSETNATNDDEQVEKDTSYSPASEQEMEAREGSPRSSEATKDPDIDQDDVTVLPGTGGPDDQGDVEVDEEDLNLDGNPT